MIHTNYLTFYLCRHHPLRDAECPLHPHKVDSLSLDNYASWMRNKAGRIKARLLRRQNDYFGDPFGHASAAFRQAAAAAAIDGRNRKRHNKKYFLLFFIAAFFIAAFSIAAIISIEERERHHRQILSSIAALSRLLRWIRALLYGPIPLTLKLSNI